MKKTVFTLLAALWATLSLPAQSYEALWKKARTQMAGDLPQSALSTLREISRKATAENNTAQLLSCTLQTLQLQAEVSLDSATVALQEMERRLAAENRPVERALWQSALGQALSTQHYRRADTAADTRARQLFRLSLSDFKPLGEASAKDYLPYFTTGKDSRHFADDVLSVLARSMLSKTRLFQRDERLALLERLIAHYRQAGNRAATLLCTLDSIRLNNSEAGPLDRKADYLHLRRLTREYTDLPLNVETYIALIELRGYNDTGNNDSLKMALAREGLHLYKKEKRAALLQNYLLRMERPTLELQASADVACPGDTVRFAVKGRNVKKARLEIYATPYTTLTLPHSVQKAAAALKKQKPVGTLHPALTADEAYLFRSDTLAWMPTAEGIYLCALRADNVPTDWEWLHVSRLQPITLSTEGRQVRITPVDRRSGKPLTGCRLLQVKSDSKTGPLYIRQATYEAKADGSFLLEEKIPYDTKFILEGATDKFSPAFHTNSYDSYRPDPTKAVLRLNLYTDRALYRPGQTVKFGAITYRQQADSVHVSAGLALKVTLYDANCKEVASQQLVSDAAGTVGGEFVLPETCLPGDFSLTLQPANGHGTATRLVSVQEYKRPTFTAELLQPDEACKLGDSLRVQGTATTYTGLPVRNAKVRWSVRRISGFSGSGNEATSGETITDDEGRFYIPVWLDGTTDEPAFRYWNRYFRFIVNADVTAESGETSDASTVLYASERGSWLHIEWPQSVCRERPGSVTVKRCNASGRNIPTTGRYEIRRGSEVAVADSFATGTPFVPAAFDTLPSGRYRVFVSCGDLPVDSSTVFTLMSETDTRPQGDEPLSFYVRTAETGDKAFILVGTPLRGVTLFHDIVSDKGIVESRRYELSDTLLHLDFDYKEAYGDGATALFAFVHNGRLYAQRTHLQKPAPDKRLILRWNTFRSLLTPGAREEWRLRVTKPDGTAADASLMACLYDASLDALRANDWHFNLPFNRLIPTTTTTTREPFRLHLEGLGTLREQRVPALDFTHPAPELFPFDGYVGSLLEGRVFGVASRNAKQKSKGRGIYETVSFAAAKQAMAAPTVMNDLAETKAVEEAADAATGAAAPVQPRTNFAETAFFHPALHTDEQGEIALVFTLPESLTSWNFRALAHDHEVRYGRLDTTVIARKEFMVQSQSPRFVRSGDAVSLPATLYNLSAAPVSGTVRCRLTDAATQQVLKEMTLPFNVDKEQVVSFRYTVPAGCPVLVCRITAEGSTFSDGEERYLPVLSDREQVTRSVPFELIESGTHALRLDTLWSDARRATDRRLVVEASSNPTWYAVAELPVLTRRDSYSATEWAARFYALTMAQHIAARNPEIRAAMQPSEDRSAWTQLLQRNPELKQTLLCETPWAAEADDEQAQAAALADLFDDAKNAARQAGALDKLRDLQQANGSWGWFKGMNGSPWITTEIALLLARQKEVTGNKAADALLTRAFSYLEKEISRRVKEMKKAEKKYKTTFSGSETQLKYLYVRALLGKKADADAKYLLDKFEVMERPTMYERALRACVFALYGRHEAAEKNVASLLEHTVQRDGRGRWFDTDRSLWCGNSYRIPTQTAAIEALVRVAPQREQDIRQMQLWLMQAKRTQSWEMLRATTDAVHALLLTPGMGGTVQPLSQHAPLLYTLRKGQKVLAVNAPSQAEAPTTVGYFKQTYDDAKILTADNVVLRKQGDGLAWGAVYAQFTIPAADVRAQGSGFTLERTLEVRREGQWQPLTAKTKLRRGERLRQVFRLTADRDYDFVSLRAGRAACLEPVEALSGYTWREGEGFYRVVRDASNEYFFEHLRKGTHLFTEECRVDRAGTYTMGTAKVQSQYAPEFSATAPSLTVTAE